MISFYLKCAIFLFIVPCAYVETAVKASEKAEKMAKLSIETGVADINNYNLKSLLLSKKRNYDVLLLFIVTRTDRNCEHCHIALDAFKQAASSWRNSANFDSSLFFAKSDFDFGGFKVFETFRVNSAPVVYFFPADHSQPQSLYMEKYGFSAEGYASFVERFTGHKIRIMQPVNYLPILISLALILPIAISIKFKWLRWAIIMDFLGLLCSLLSVAFISLMTSGFMWNHMRGAPLYHQDGKQKMFISPGMDNQLIAESLIIFAINLLIGGGMVVMSHVGNFPVKTGRKAYAYAWCGLLVTVLSYYGMWSTFTSKYYGYPKTFLFL